MKTTTIYRETLTITTEDNGARTIERSSHAQTLREYYFTELTPEAQQRAIDDAIEEETDPANWYGSQTYFAEREIIDAAEEMEKHQPIEIAQDYGCSWYGKTSTYRFGSYDAYEHVTEEQHTGIVYSMDICDKWNEYAPRIMALAEAVEDIDAMLYDIGGAADSAEYDRDMTDNPAEYDRLEAIRSTAAAEYEQLDTMRDRCAEVAEELTEEAARAVGDVVDGLIEAERDYYQSAEFWHEWLADSDDRYTRDGARI